MSVVCRVIGACAIRALCILGESVRAWSWFHDLAEAFLKRGLGPTLPRLLSLLKPPSDPSPAAYFQVLGMPNRAKQGAKRERGGGTHSLKTTFPFKPPSNPLPSRLFLGPWNATQTQASLEGQGLLGWCLEG